jgi:hypothetical protein
MGQMKMKCIFWKKNISILAKATQVSDVAHGPLVSKSKGHNFVKNQWIRTKLKLDLYLGMAKQYTKY